VTTPDPARKIAAECIGTMILVATVVGSGIMAEQLAGGNTAIALLGNTLSTGAMLVVLITILGPVSGAHFNPLVSASAAVQGNLAKRLWLPFMAAQIVGGIAGALLANAMFDLEIIQISTKDRTGTGVLLSETVATIALFAAIIGGTRHAPNAVPLLVGLTITAAYWFTASTSFANPAVTIARMFSDTFAGISPASVPPFIAAQAIGALIATIIWNWLFARTQPR
jgi:glycerol uptake facilitator-like aquaporin